MMKEYIADKATLDNVNSIVSAFNNRWPDARASKVDNIQAVLNTPDGNTLAAWIQSISNSAANAYNKANEANNNAANAANLASQANSNAWNAYQEAVNAKNAAGGSAIRIVSALVSNGNSFAGTGKGILFIGASNADQQPTIIIDGVNIGNIVSLYYAPIQMKFSANFSVGTKSNASPVCCNAIFY